MNNVTFYTGNGIPQQMDSNGIYLTKEGRMYYNDNLIGEELDKLKVSNYIEQSNNVTATGKGYYFWKCVTGDKQTPYPNYVVLSDKQLQQASSSFVPPADWSVGDHLSILNYNNYDYCSTIVHIAENIIYVDKLPTIIDTSHNTTINILTNPDGISIDKIVINVDKPTSGTIVVGWNNAIFGEENTAILRGAIAAGLSNKAVGQYSAAFGRDNIVGWSGISGGIGNVVSSNAGYSFGNGNVVTGNGAGALGIQTIASGRASLSIGLETRANGDNSFATGYKGRATNYCSTIFGGVEGNEVHESGGKFGFVEGRANRNYGTAAHVEGFNNENLANCVHVEGSANYVATTSASSAHIEGSSNIIGSTDSPSGKNSHVEGYHNYCYASNAHAEGKGNIVEEIAEASHVEGWNNMVRHVGASVSGIGNKSSCTGQTVVGVGCNYDSTSAAIFVVGNGTVGDNGSITSRSNAMTVYTNGCVSIGDNSISSGEDSFATGSLHTINGNYCVIGGYENIVSESQAVAFGYHNQSTGISSFSEGSNNEATNDNAHAEGYQTKASGNNAHSQGYATLASGKDSFAGGNHTSARGDNSTALGYYSAANKDATLASGVGVIADTWGQSVVGRYNKYGTDALFVVGNGLDDGNRQNAMEVLQNGVVKATAFNNIKSSRTQPTSGLVLTPDSSNNNFYHIPLTKEFLTYDCAWLVIYGYSDDYIYHTKNLYVPYFGELWSRTLNSTQERTVCIDDIDNPDGRFYNAVELCLDGYFLNLGKTGAGEATVFIYDIIQIKLDGPGYTL